MIENKYILHVNILREEIKMFSQHMFMHTKMYSLQYKEEIHTPHDTVFDSVTGNTELVFVSYLIL